MRFNRSSNLDVITTHCRRFSSSIVSLYRSFVFSTSSSPSTMPTMSIATTTTSTTTKKKMMKRKLLKRKMRMRIMVMRAAPLRTQTTMKKNLKSLFCPGWYECCVSCRLSERPLQLGLYSLLWRCLFRCRWWMFLSLRSTHSSSLCRKSLRGREEWAKRWHSEVSSW